MRILITGGRGMLGSDLCAVLGREHTCVPTGSAEADVTKAEAVARLVEREQPDAIIHAAAFTDVDGCERDPERAFLVNALGAYHVAAAAAAVGSALFLISTDYVFDGAATSPYTEFDAPNPINRYGASKRAGEELALRTCSRCVVVRTQWLYGAHGKNFVSTIRRAAREGRPLRVVADQIGAPTWAQDLAAGIGGLLSRVERGAGPLLPVYHLNNAGSCSWYEFAVAILQSSGLGDVPVAPITSAEWPAPARRPAYSVLRRYALELTGEDRMRPWQGALAEFLTLDATASTDQHSA
jgi:dTDP-4-dehydrorhamnose reductase